MWMGGQVPEGGVTCLGRKGRNCSRDHHFRGDRPYADFRQLPMARDGALGSGCTAYVAETRSATRSAPQYSTRHRQAG